MIIAIDFDGTIVEHRYPEIGKEMLFAFETMKELQKQNHQLILWTLRTGIELEEAVEFCRERGIEFYAVNKNFPEEKEGDGKPRKLEVDIFIDDRIIGGFPGWSQIWQIINGPSPGMKEEIRRVQHLSDKKKGWLGRIFRFYTLFLLIAIIGYGCAGNRDQVTGQKKGRTGRKTAVPAVTRIISPENGQQLVAGQEINVSLEVLSDTVGLDSVGCYLGGKPAGKLSEGPFEYRFSTAGMKVGSIPIRVIAWYPGDRRDIHNLEIVLLSDIQPIYIPYSIENTYIHDDRAYTQGLVYRDGFLYEGTGNYNESSLRKVIIESGEAVHLMSLPGDVFGEGITIFNDKIYQLTYRSQVGFVYDLESFRRLQKVYYQNKEGWGLTHDGESLIMSDGTHRIYYMDPEYFTELKQVEVYDENGPVVSLNELEYIDDKIFANIFGQEIIVIIDPESGKVTGRLNMKGILTQPVGDRRRDVFNGIAWNPDSRLLYVTGKYWPSLFEVRLKGEF